MCNDKDESLREIARGKLRAAAFLHFGDGDLAEKVTAFIETHTEAIAYLFPTDVIGYVVDFDDDGEKDRIAKLLTCTGIVIDSFTPESGSLEDDDHDSAHFLLKGSEAEIRDFLERNPDLGEFDHAHVD